MENDLVVAHSYSMHLFARRGLLLGILLQAWLVAEGFPNLARILVESRRTLPGMLSTGAYYGDPYAEASKVNTKPG